MTGALPTLTAAMAARFAAIALGHVTREYPNKLDHVMAGPAQVQSPRALHPIFYGSFDWHSCVHGYWMLARLRRRFPTMAQAPAIAALFDQHFTPSNVAAEAAYAADPTHAGFERPYGWAWLLMLAAELTRDASEAGKRWEGQLRPLTAAFVRRFQEFLPKAQYPIRVGTHYNTAFAITLALDFAETYGDATLATLLRDKARAWYGADVDCQGWEPSGDDFLSPTLIEAECMRASLPRAEFIAWFDRFLPRLAAGSPATLFQPASVSDRGDGKIAHLEGLNLSRAWCWRRLAAALPAGDARRPAMLDAAARHLASGLPFVAGDYMAEHWMASFAVLALDY